MIAIFKISMFNNPVSIVVALPRGKSVAGKIGLKWKLNLFPLYVWVLEFIDYELVCDSCIAFQ